MRASKQIINRIMAWLMFVVCVACVMPMSSASAAVSEYNCTYITFKERSINQSCDLGIEHHAILYGQEKVGPRVGVVEDRGNGPGVSRAPVLDAQIPYISRSWTRVFH